MGHIDVIAMCVQLPANKVKGRPSAATPALTKQPITPLKPRRQAEDDSDDEEDFVPTRGRAQAASRVISPQEEPSNQTQLMANHGRAPHPDIPTSPGARTSRERSGDATEEQGEQ